MQRRNVVKLNTIVTMLLLIMLATACSSVPPTPTVTVAPPVPTSNGSEETTTPSAEKPSQIKAVEEIVDTVAQRTPVPTATPGPVGEMIGEFTSQVGLAEQSFLGLTAVTWINVGASILFALLGILLGIYLLFGLLKWIARRTKTQFDDRSLETVGRELRWLMAIVIIRMAFLRLEFWDDGSRLLLEDLFFLLSLVMLYIISLRLVAFAAEWYRETRVPDENRKALNPLIEMFERLGFLFVSVAAASIALSHFGINITLLSAVLLFVVVVVAVGARAAINDAVSGFLILIDRPFSVGDDIYLKELETWGRVTNIGIRITSIRPPDNREVTIPNSLIGQSQVINYTYPDPSFRIRTEIGVAFGTDSGQLQRVVEGAVRGVEGVLPERPVDVIFLAFGESARQVRVRWWIDDVNHQDRVLNRVNAAIEQALAEAGIEIPFQTYALNLKTEYAGHGGLIDGEGNVPGQSEPKGRD